MAVTRSCRGAKNICVNRDPLCVADDRVEKDHNLSSLHHSHRLALTVAAFYFAMRS